MKINKIMLACAASLLIGASVPTVVVAQPLAPIPEALGAPREFATAIEHFEYLKRQAGGGTHHTYESVPKWEGLWQAGYNNIALRGGVSPFFEGPIPPGLSAGGTVSEGVLSPEYQAAFEQRRENMLKYNEQPYDRLSTCEAVGPARWLLEPYVREFVNTPTQSWWMNDLANETRRIYIDQEHKNIEGAHTPDGDSIGFWAGDKLVVHTQDIWPADYFRGYPPTSNELEMVEVWELVTLPNGLQRIEVQVTFYDPIGLAKPLNGVYTYTRAAAQEDAGYRLRHWDCNSSVQQRVETEDGVETTIRLPGEAGKSWHEMRNPDLPPDLPGQTQSPDQVDFDTIFSN